MPPEGIHVSTVSSLGVINSRTLNEIYLEHAIGSLLLKHIRFLYSGPGASNSIHTYVRHGV